MIANCPVVGGILYEPTSLRNHQPAKIHFKQLGDLEYIGHMANICQKNEYWKTSACILNLQQKQAY